MNDATFYDETSQLFLLCTIELCADVFRGMSNDDCSLLCRDGLADLHPLYAADKGKLVDLCEAVANLEAFANTFASDLDGFCERASTEYIRLFVTNSDGIPAPPYASCYESILQADAATSSEGGLQANSPPHDPIMGQPAQRMQALLAGVGLIASSATNEPADHIATQLEYLYFLLSTGWRDGDAEARTKATQFARIEMQPWVSKFAEALSTHDQFGLFSGSAAILMAMLEYVTE